MKAREEAFPPVNVVWRHIGEDREVTRSPQEIFSSGVKSLNDFLVVDIFVLPEVLKTDAMPHYSYVW